MSTTTRNSDPTLKSLSTDEDQRKAIDELFSQLGQKAGAERPARPLAALPTPDSGPIMQSPPCGPKRQPLAQHTAAPARRQPAVRASCDDDDDHTWGDRLRQVIFVGCLVLASMLFVKAMPASWFASVNNATASRESATVNPAGAAAETKLQTIPIEKVQVGDRVVGTNPIREQAEGVEPDPATWRKISLHMRKESGLSLWIDLLRPLEWIETNGVELGKTVFLSMPEMGAVGDAEVTYLGPCPPIKPGQGAVVTGKFTHQADASSNVVRLRLEGQAEATGVTDNHPYWSEYREAYVEVGRLRIGELVNTEYGLRRVESITPYSDYNGLLYNIESTEHVYRVGSLGTLVHNSCAGFNPRMRQALDWLKVRGFDSSKATPFASKFSERFGSGRLNGMRNGNIGYRIEFDARSGAHINVFAGKEIGPHFSFSQSEADMLAVLRQLFGK